ncbi:uncharacterized protein LOC131066782 isoform X2 [Cryptomeria japonica]|uniref:uncharacterized protein LOC131066782 isoform X2 n=1 Tax=Cryptomeria japonica TaxID=3369 RepID=UPI0027DA8134|nr:uncharacterized protein LOC131066782 isoform X2 [Cryptomeria japonica]
MDKVTDSPSSWEDLYSINLTPKEIFVKLRKQVEGHQLGLNFEENSYNTKLVFKPLTPERKWKFIYEPKIGDVRLLTNKIPIGKFLNLQVGMGYSFHDHSAGWKWKLTTSLGGDGISQIRHKALLPIFPGFDVRIGWNAEYILPDIHGAVGTGEPIIGMNLGRLYTSIDRVEAILTHAT